MKTVETYRWRVLWIKRWITTSFHMSEADIRVEHPEAVRVEGTCIMRQEPETVEDHIALASGGNASTRVG